MPPDGGAAAPPPPERQLQLRWAEARVPARLDTEDGDALWLTFAGTWNHGAGPDFQRARLQTADGRTIRGDVEVHRRAADWVSHGHGDDPRYAAVALHVVAERPEADGVVMPGRRLYVLRPAGGEAAASLPCERLTPGASGPAVTAALSRVALQRLGGKRRRMQAAMDLAGDPDQAAYAALLTALGQGGNATAMAALARALPLRDLPADAEAARVALLATADRLEARGVVRWRRGGLRPVNRPQARLAAAAELLDRFAPGLADGLAALADREETEALRALHVPRGLGAERARQLLVDVCYPLALCRAAPPDTVGLARRWLELGPATHGRTAALRARIAAGGADVESNGPAQAFLELEQSYCRHGACRVCPLARLAASPRGPRGPLPSPNR